jgi:hypothetical protein
MITIEKLWNAMPRDVQRKISCHDLKRIMDNLNPKPVVYVCGVDCHPGDENCNGYCTGKTDCAKLHSENAGVHGPRP